MTEHQGPYAEKPDFDPPALPYDWARLRESRRWIAWKQVSDGSWYAFYGNIGPGAPWGEEHPDDPNYWYNRNHRNNPGELVCRHGALVGQCPDPNKTCGSGPMPGFTEEDVLNTQMQAIRLLKDMEATYGGEPGVLEHPDTDRVG